MFHTFKKAAPVVAAALLTASAAAAESDWLADENFSGSVALTSDYVWRGVSQSGENWATQGSFDYAAPNGLYAGIWASSIDFPGFIEIDYYGGYANELEMGLGYDVGVNYYHYPKDSADPSQNFVELYLSLGYSLPIEALPISVGAGYNYSPDFYGEDGTGNYFSGSLEVALPYDFTLSGDVGHQDVEGDKSSDGFDYWHWRLGVAYSIKGFDFDVSYHESDEDTDLSDERVVFTIARAL